MTMQATTVAQDQTVGQLESVTTFDGAMLTGVTVSHGGRIFVNFPKWGDQVAYTVAEVKDGRTVAYPNAAFNQPQSDTDAGALISVQSVVVDPNDRLWILDTGSPMFKSTAHGGPKLVGVDLTTNQVFQTILFPEDVALPTTYLNDVRFDLRRGSAGMAFITDSATAGPNAIIVVDLASGASWRKLHEHPSTKPVAGILPIVEGRPMMERRPGQPPRSVSFGADSIAIGADGARLYYAPLASRRLYSVSTDALADRAMSDDQVAATVVDEGDKGGVADGLESDTQGRVYATSPEHDAIVRRNADGQYETVVHDPRLLWPDTMSLAADGYLYVTSNQLHRQATYHDGKDLRQKPYSLFRVRVDAHPVLLR